MIAAIYARRRADLNVYALTTRRQREQLAEYLKSASTRVYAVSHGAEPPAAGAGALLAAPPPVEPPVPSDRSC